MAGLNDFISYLQTEKRFADHTIRSYRTDLEQYHAFCQSCGAEGMDLYFRTIRNWVVELMEEGYSPRTIHRKLSSLRSYCRFLIRRGELDSDPVQNVLKPRMNKRVPSFVDEVSMDKLLDDYEFGEDFTGVRNKVIINLLYQTGIRRSELIGLTVDSFKRADRSLKVMGKRNKERILPLTDEMVEELSGYLRMRNDRYPVAESDILLLTDRGKAVYPRFIYRVVTNYLGMVSTLEKTSPHILRHTFATHMLNRGADLNTIKELLGHANLSATQIYTHNTFEKLKHIYKQAHPRA